MRASSLPHKSIKPVADDVSRCVVIRDGARQNGQQIEPTDVHTGAITTTTTCSNNSKAVNSLNTCRVAASNKRESEMQKGEQGNVQKVSKPLKKGVNLAPFTKRDEVDLKGEAACVGHSVADQSHKGNAFPNFPSCTMTTSVDVEFPSIHSLIEVNTKSSNLYDTCTNSISRNISKSFNEVSSSRPERSMRSSNSSLFHYTEGGNVLLRELFPFFPESLYIERSRLRLTNIHLGSGVYSKVLLGELYESIPSESSKEKPSTLLNKRSNTVQVTHFNSFSGSKGNRGPLSRFPPTTRSKTFSAPHATRAVIVLPSSSPSSPSKKMNMFRKKNLSAEPDNAPLASGIAATGSESTTADTFLDAKKKNGEGQGEAPLKCSQNYRPEKSNTESLSSFSYVEEIKRSSEDTADTVHLLATVSTQCSDDRSEIQHDSLVPASSVNSNNSSFCAILNRAETKRWVDDQMTSPTYTRTIRTSMENPFGTGRASGTFSEWDSKEVASSKDASCVKDKKIEVEKVEVALDEASEPVKKVLSQGSCVKKKDSNFSSSEITIHKNVEVATEVTQVREDENNRHHRHHEYHHHHHDHNKNKKKRRPNERGNRNTITTTGLLKSLNEESCTLPFEAKPSADLALSGTPDPRSERNNGENSLILFSSPASRVGDEWCVKAQERMLVKPLKVEELETPVGFQTLELKNSVESADESPAHLGSTAAGEHIQKAVASLTADAKESNRCEEKQDPFSDQTNQNKGKNDSCGFIAPDAPCHRSDRKEDDGAACTGTTAILPKDLILQPANTQAKQMVPLHIDGNHETATAKDCAFPKCTNSDNLLPVERPSSGVKPNPLLYSLPSQPTAASSNTESKQSMSVPPHSAPRLCRIESRKEIMTRRHQERVRRRLLISLENDSIHSIHRGSTYLDDDQSDFGFDSSCTNTSRIFSVNHNSLQSNIALHNPVASNASVSNSNCNVTAPAKESPGGASLLRAGDSGQGSTDFVQPTKCLPHSQELIKSGVRDHSTQVSPPLVGSTFSDTDGIANETLTPPLSLSQEPSNFWGPAFRYPNLCPSPPLGNSSGSHFQREHTECGNGLPSVSYLSTERENVNEASNSIDQIPAEGLSSDVDVNFSHRKQAESSLSMRSSSTHPIPPYPHHLCPLPVDKVSSTCSSFCPITPPSLVDSTPFPFSSRASSFFPPARSFSLSPPASLMPSPFLAPSSGIPSQGSSVAVKVMSKLELSRPAFVEALVNEVRMALQLRGRDPSVATVLGLSEDAQNVYVVMDVAEGGNMRQYIQRHGVEDTRKMAPRFIADVVKALRYLADGKAHPWPEHRVRSSVVSNPTDTLPSSTSDGMRKVDNNNNNDNNNNKNSDDATKGEFSEEFCKEEINSECGAIAHRDLKPANLLFTRDFHVKLGDFGAACYIHDDEGNKFGGTPFYISPEVIKTGKAGETSDLWALGCVLYELLTGRPPFKGETPLAVLQAIKSHQVDSSVYAFPPTTIKGENVRKEEESLINTGANHCHSHQKNKTDASSSTPCSDKKKTKSTVRHASSEVLSATEECHYYSSSAAASSSASTNKKTVKVGNIEFPPYFPKDAMDLVLQLLHPVPHLRLGSKYRGGFDVLEKHPFFKDINWETLRETSNITPQNTDYSAPVTSYLEKNEHIIYCSPVIRTSKREWARLSERHTNREVNTRKQRTILVLTDTPRLFLFDKEKRLPSRHFQWSSNLFAEVKNIEKFRIYVENKKKYYFFYDPNSRADFWGMKINDTVKRTMLRHQDGCANSNTDSNSKNSNNKRLSVPLTQEADTLTCDSPSRGQKNQIFTPATTRLSTSYGNSKSSIISFTNAKRMSKPENKKNSTSDTKISSINANTDGGLTLSSSSEMPIIFSRAGNKKGEAFWCKIKGLFTKSPNTKKN